MKNYYIENVGLDKDGDIVADTVNQIREFDILDEAYKYLLSKSNQVTNKNTFLLYAYDEEYKEYECIYEMHENKNFELKIVLEIAKELEVDIETYEVGKLDENYNFYDVEERIEEESLDKLVNVMYEKSGCWSFDEYKIKAIIDNSLQNEIEEQQQTM